MVQPGGVVVLLCAPVNERTKHTLRNDGADLSGRGTDSMRGRAVACRETFAGDNEGYSVRTEVEKELRHNVETQETVVRLLQLVIAKANCDENDSKNCKSDELNWLATQSINGRNGDPITGNGTSADQNQISDGIAVKYLVDILPTSPSNS